MCAGEWTNYLFMGRECIKFNSSREENSVSLRLIYILFSRRKLDGTGKFLMQEFDKGRMDWLKIPIFGITSDKYIGDILASVMLLKYR